MSLTTVETGKALLTQQVAMLRNSASNVELSSLYSTSALTKACAEFWADNIAQVKFKVYDENDEPVDEKETQDATAALLCSPEFKGVLRKTELTLRFWGHSLSRKQYNGFGIVRDLSWLNPFCYQRDANSLEGLKGWRVYPGKYQKQEIDYINLKDGVYFQEFSFDDEYDGVSSAEVVALQAATEPEVAMTQLAFFRNMAIPSAIIQPAKDANTGTNSREVPSLTRFIAQRFQGSYNAARTLITPSRWEAIQLQTPLKDLNLGDQYKDLRETIATAFNLSVGFISIGQSQYNELEGQIAVWLDRRFKPRTLHYADFLTSQLLYNRPGYRIKADISDLVRADEKVKTEVVSMKIDSTVITLYDAQISLNQVPDERLKDIYMVNGVPVHADDMREYSKNLLNRTAGANDAGGATGNGSDKPQQGVQGGKERMDKRFDRLDKTPKPDRPREAPRTTKESAFVSEEVFAELKVAIRKAKKKQEFVPNLIGEDVWRGISVLVESGVSEDEVMLSAKEQYLSILIEKLEEENEAEDE